MSLLCFLVRWVHYGRSIMFIGDNLCILHIYDISILGQFQVRQFIAAL